MGTDFAAELAANAELPIYGDVAVGGPG